MHPLVTWATATWDSCQLQLIVGVAKSGDRLLCTSTWATTTSVDACIRRACSAHACLFSGRPEIESPRGDMHAEEGDVRLVEPSTVANWQVGRLEIFFEGSWSQVCARAFNAPDADVACRQLGYGAGTVGPVHARVRGELQLPEAQVFPEVALTTPGCNGSEATLLDCGPSSVRLTEFQTRDCYSTDSPGLMLACVADPVPGVPRVLDVCFHLMVERDANS